MEGNRILSLPLLLSVAVMNGLDPSALTAPFVILPVFCPFCTHIGSNAAACHWHFLMTVTPPPLRGILPLTLPALPLLLSVHYHAVPVWPACCSGDPTLLPLLSPRLSISLFSLLFPLCLCPVFAFAPFVFDIPPTTWCPHNIASSYFVLFTENSSSFYYPLRWNAYTLPPHLSLPAIKEGLRSFLLLYTR